MTWRILPRHCNSDANSIKTYKKNGICAFIDQSGLILHSILPAPQNRASFECVLLSSMHQPRAKRASC
jgi:hypothetical protein